jgi:hypothetical protein
MRDVHLIITELLIYLDFLSNFDFSSLIVKGIVWNVRTMIFNLILIIDNLLFNEIKFASIFIFRNIGIFYVYVEKTNCNFTR